MWGNTQWATAFFSQQAKSDDYLAQYSCVFNTVEGNTTFYGLPHEDLVARWKEQAAQDFRFCFKLPQRVTHGLKLAGAEKETNQFFSRLAVLEERLGPFMLQLAADFGPERLPVLQRYLKQLPADFNIAVEVRNPAFYKERDTEQRLNDLLAELAVDRVMLDSRPLFSARATNDSIRDAQRKKPRLPANTYELGKYPVLRFIGHPTLEGSRQYFRPWQRKVARWVSEGRQPFIFMHTPDNVYAPDLAREFHNGVEEFLEGWSALPAFPSEQRANKMPDAKQGVLACSFEQNDCDEEQLDLF